MDSLLLFLLLLGGAPDQPVTGASAGPARVQAVASARILRGQAIALGAPVSLSEPPATSDGAPVLRLAPIRSTAALRGADGQTIQLQEFQ